MVSGFWVIFAGGPMRHRITLAAFPIWKLRERDGFKRPGAHLLQTSVQVQLSGQGPLVHLFGLFGFRSGTCWNRKVVWHVLISDIRQHWAESGLGFEELHRRISPGG